LSYPASKQTEKGKNITLAERGSKSCTKFCSTMYSK